MPRTQRISWDDYFLQILVAVSLRSTCDRGKCGCVIVKDNRVLSTGYAGAPAGLPDCYEKGHLLQKVIWPSGKVSEHCIRSIHAEQNAIAQAAKFGILLNNSTLYTTMEPCFNCAKLIVAVGVKRVVSQNSYQEVAETRDLFKNADIELCVVKDTPLQY